MKKIWLLAVLMMSVVGCKCSTQYGECVGVLDDPDPKLKYEASTRNIMLGAILVETIVVPAVVVLTDLKCPVGPKAAP